MANTFKPLLVILFFSLLARVLVIYFLPSLHHADENFQLFEQAHLISFGYGISPWEFHDGIRSLVLPSVLSKIFDAASIITDRPEFYIDGARVVLAIFFCLPVAALYLYGSTKSIAHALIPSIVLGLWFETVYFSIRPLNESVAAACLVCATCFGLLAQQDSNRRSFLIAGFFAALAMMFRLQLGAGVAVLAIWVCRFDLKHRWLPFIVGGVPPAIVFGASDWAAWGAPFSSFARYIKINLIDGKAAHYGVEPFWWYFGQILDNWSGFIAIIAVLILYGLRSNLLWVLIAGAIFIPHSIIEHKEYRFIYPALVCLIIAAALGSADLVQTLRKVFPKERQRITAAAILIWIATSAALAVSPGFSANWLRSRDAIQAFYFLSSQKDLCGLLLYETDWTDTGGYAHLHRNIPIYDNEDKGFEIKKVVPLANYIVTPENSIQELPNHYRLIRCSGKDKESNTCILKRAGSCTVRSDIISLTQQDRLGEE